MIKIIDQTLILMLAIDAAWVAYGVSAKRNMWVWILLYWVILTAHNFVAYMVL